MSHHMNGSNEIIKERRTHFAYFISRIMSLDMSPHAVFSIHTHGSALSK